MQSNLPLETLILISRNFFQSYFSSLPKLYSTLCTSHHRIEIGKVYCSSLSLHTPLYLPKLSFIHLQDTSYPQISSSIYHLMPTFIHSLIKFINWTRTVFSFLCWYTFPFLHIFTKSVSLKYPPHHYTGPAHSVYPISITIFHP